jgi:hypothetical protein
LKIQFEVGLLILLFCLFPTRVANFPRVYATEQNPQPPPPPPVFLTQEEYYWWKMEQDWLDGKLTPEEETKLFRHLEYVDFLRQVAKGEAYFPGQSPGEIRYKQDLQAYNEWKSWKQDHPILTLGLQLLAFNPYCPINTPLNTPYTSVPLSPPQPQDYYGPRPVQLAKGTSGVLR